MIGQHNLDIRIRKPLFAPDGFEVIDLSLLTLTDDQHPVIRPFRTLTAS